MSEYGSAFDQFASRWASLENEHDEIHPSRDECGGVGGCSMMFGAVGLEHAMLDALRAWRTR